MGNKGFGWACLGAAWLAAGGLALSPTVVIAQTTTNPPGAQPAPTREALQHQLDAQNAKNEQLRQRIAKLEEMLKTDVCNNPEAEALLKSESQSAPR